MTFRLKVVLWFSLSLLISLVVVHLATIGVVRLLINDELDSSLEAEVNWLDDFLLTYKGRQVPDSEICNEIQQRSRMNPRKEFISIWDASGNSYFNTRNLEGQSLPHPDSVSQLITLKDFRGQDVRFVGKTKGGYSIAIGYSLTETESAIRSIVISSNIIAPGDRTVCFCRWAPACRSFVAADQRGKPLSRSRCHPSTHTGAATPRRRE